MERECYEEEVQPYQKMNYKPILYMRHTSGLSWIHSIKSVFVRVGNLTAWSWKTKKDMVRTYNIKVYTCILIYISFLAYIYPFVTYITSYGI